MRHDVKGDLAEVAEEVSRGVLMNLPREKLVEELMKTQAMVPNGGDTHGSKDGNDVAPPKARSSKAPSRGQRSVIGWAGAAGPLETGQPGGFKPDTGNGSVKGGKAVVASGWAQEGAGTTAQEVGFKPDNSAPVAAKKDVVW